MKKLSTQSKVGFLTSILALAISTPVFAAPATVSLANNATDLVNLLLGGNPGFTVVGTPTYTGVDPANNTAQVSGWIGALNGGTVGSTPIGTFSGGLGAPVTGLPFNNGVLLSTGNLSDGDSPNNFQRISKDYWGFGSGPNIQSTQLATAVGVTGGPSNTHDATTLSFQFTSTFVAFQFQYAFASEEYTETVGTGLGDAFAFILRDLTMDPSGNTFVNLAKIGASNVSVDTVNTTSNPSYYLNNPWVDGTGASSPFATEYDGIAGGATKNPLFAAANIVPGHVYQIDAVVADIGDGQGDSAVFIGAGSFQEAPPVGPVPEPSTYVGALALVGLIARRLRRKA
jgi:hypothetical protein